MFEKQNLTFREAHLNHDIFDKIEVGQQNHGLGEEINSAKLPSALEFVVKTRKVLSCMIFLLES